MSTQISINIKKCRTINKVTLVFGFEKMVFTIPPPIGPATSFAPLNKLPSPSY